MPNGISSAVPAHLFTLGRESIAGAVRVVGAGARLDVAIAALLRSDSVGLPPSLRSGIVEELIAAGARTTAWSDGVLDVAAAFAVAGAGTTIGGSVGCVVEVDDHVVADILSLPDGRVLSVEELAALTPGQVRAWYQRLLDLPGFEDGNFRAVEALLYAVERGTAEAGQFSIFADPAFDLADAAVLASMRDGWLASRGVTPPAWPPSPAAEARAAAVAGWAEWFDTYEALPEERRDEVWALAEEGSVRAGEQLLVDRGTGFGPGMMVLVPFTHNFRYAVATDREGELVRSLLDTVDLEPLKDRAATVAGAWVAAGAGEAEDRARSGLDRLRDLLPAGPELLLDLHVRAIAETGAVAGAMLDTIVDIVPLEVRGVGVGDLLDRVGFGDDLDVITEVLVDPSATPPDLAQRFLDDIIGEPPPYPDPAGAYYLARLTDLGYLPGLSDGRPFPGAVPTIPTS